MRTLLADCLRDVRFALRQVSRVPVLSAVVTLSLALGIGANSAMFSAIETVLFRPLPVKAPEQLVMLTWSAKDSSRLYQDLEGGGGRTVGATGGVSDVQSFPYATYGYIRDHNNVFAATMAVAGNTLNANLGLGGRAESATMQGVSGNFFEGMGISAFIGRTIQADDDKDTSVATAVVSYPFWQTKLGGGRSVLGQTINLNGQPVIVVGVAPHGFFGIEPGSIPDLWVSLHQFSAMEAATGNSNNGVPFVKDPKTWWLQIIGRRIPEVTDGAARSQADTLFTQSLAARGRSRFS